MVLWGKPNQNETGGLPLLVAGVTWDIPKKPGVVRLERDYTWNPILRMELELKKNPLRTPQKTKPPAGAPTT